MSLFSKLFKKTQTQPEPISSDYKGFLITPKPIKEDQGYRLATIIQKGNCQHNLIRADLFNSSEEAASVATQKAERLIDSMGDDLFNQPSPPL